MGCGCLNLSPQKRQTPIFRDTIRDIHNEAQQFQGSESDNLHKQLRQQIQKKGKLKKLVDHLSTHRGHVQSSINQNLLLVTQKNNSVSSYAGLLISNAIIKGIYDACPEIFRQNKDKGTIMITYDSTSTIQQRYLINQNSLLKEYDFKFEEPYFRMIIFLLRNHPRIYTQVLQSLKVFAYKRVYKANYPQMIVLILEEIRKNLDQNKKKQQSTQVYFMLLRLIKAHYKEDLRKSDHIGTFFQQWLAQEHLQIKENLYQIVKIYVRRYILQWQAKKVYEIVLKIYDHHFFRKNDIAQLQDAIFDMIEGEDLSEQFMRDFILSLFAYISFCKDQSLIERWKIVGWGYLDEQLKNNYQNIFNQQSKINALQTIRRIGSFKKVVDINQTIKYNRSSFTYAYLFNILVYSENSAVCSEIMNQLFQISQILNSKSVNIILEVFYQQTNNQKLEQKHFQYLITIIKKMINKKEIYCQRDKSYLFFIFINPHFTKKMKQQSIQLAGFIIKMLPNTIINEKIQQLCSFLASLQQNIFYSEILTAPLQLLNSTISFFKDLLEKDYKILIIAFLKRISDLNPPVDKITEFFYILEQHQILSILTPHQLPAKILMLKQKIANSHPRENQVLRDIIYNAMKQEHKQLYMPQKISQLLSTVTENDKFQVHYSILQIMMKNDQARQSAHKDYEGFQQMKSVRSTFMRKSSLNELGSEGNSVDYSFDCILQMINE